MILVTGATGVNGSELVRRLSARGIPVRALTRTAAKAATLSGLPGVEIAVGDMARPESLEPALRGIDRAVLISSAAPDMVDVQSNFISAAARAGVKHVVKLSGIMPELTSPFRFARMHGEVEQRLEKSGLAFTHLRAGEFMTAYFRQVPSILAKGAIFLPMADARIASIDVGDIAEVAIITLTSPGHEGKIYPITGPEALTMSEVADRLSAATGRTIRYVNVAPEDAKRAQLASGVPPYMADALAELFAERATARRVRSGPCCRRCSGCDLRVLPSLSHVTRPSSAEMRRHRKSDARPSKHTLNLETGT